MADTHTGSRIEVGIGIGSNVAPNVWPKHLGLSLRNRVRYGRNNSAVGRVEEVNDSAVTGVWADGTLKGKLTDVVAGYLLYGIQGGVSTADNADTNVSVKDHTFDVVQTNTPPAMTITRKEASISNQRHTMAAFEELTLEGDADAEDSWIKFSANIQALAGADGTDTPSYGTSEYEFLMKHLRVKIASSVAGLGAATALSVRQINLTISRPLSPDWGGSTGAPTAFDWERYKCSGELTLRYRNSDLEDLWYAGTKRAMSISLVNTDVTIGAAANPGVVFTGPQVVLNTFDKNDDDIDAIQEQTVGFEFELSLADSYAVRPVVTNTTASYA